MHVESAPREAVGGEDLLLVVEQGHEEAPVGVYVRPLLSHQQERLLQSQFLKMHDECLSAVECAV
jgi:hypothetical protein